MDERIEFFVGLDAHKDSIAVCPRLAQLSRAGELKAIWVPDEAHDAMRNLWRAREDAMRWGCG